MNIPLMTTILIVEDTQSEMELISHYLREQGYMVINAVNAQEAIDKAIKQKPNIIISDIIMPGVSGFELCRTLKKHPATKEMPIILCSSKDQDIDRLWGMKQGADAYITKPFTREHLVQTVKSVIG